MAAPNSNHPLEQTFIQPVLASTLYEAALNRKRRRVERIANDVTGPCTGVKAIDEVVLEGSFATQDENGAIVGIAIERALEQEQVQWWSKQLLHQIISKHLSSGLSASGQPLQQTRVYLIDSTGAFSPRLLQSLLVSRMRSNLLHSASTGFSHQGGYIYSASRDDPRASTDANETICLESTVKLLDQVALLRIFDFEGLMEAVGEIADAVTSGDAPASAASVLVDCYEQTRSDGTVVEESVPNAHAGLSTLTSKTPFAQESSKTGSVQCEHALQEVADSDDESDAHDIGLDLQSKNASHHCQGDSEEEAANASRWFPTTSTAHDTRIQQEQNRSRDACKSLIYVSSLHAVLSPLLKKNYIRGQALLVHLLRRLRQLAQLDEATVILENTTIAPEHDRQTQSDVTSAFEDIVCRPALGRTLARGLDVSLMLAKLPTTRSSVIVECLQDQFSERVGNWVALQMGDADADGIPQVKRATA